MIPEAPFLFSIAALSASLAGLAGLVAGLRRGADVRRIDLFRLRQIVEFSFANVILALATVPVSVQLDDPATVVRVMAGIGLAYALVTATVLVLRMRHWNIAWTVGWQVGVAVLNLAIIAAGVAAIATGSFAAYELLLMALLGRPMLAFLLVLASLEAQ
ncbi:MAG TPA: hypothetical protein VFX65_05645 [Candidatus Limnocylindrales bacterium]|nr:hypothetical protein [Candidatus Limnocylindrales bacterium]